MSKLQELKNKLCSNGIEYKKLRETCIIKSGEFASPKELSKIQDDLHIYPCYGSNGLRGYINKFNYDGEYPIVGRVGACGSVNYINGKYFITDNAFIVKSKKNEYIPKFLYYLLKSLNLNKYKLGGAQPAINGKMIYDLSAPIPPLEVQEEIVRILDPLTKDVNELIDLLKREQDLRKKQYAYYRDKLLTFGEDTPKVKLGEVAEIGTGGSNTDEQLEEGLYPFFVRSPIVRRKNNFEFDEIAIITSGDGVGVGKIFHYVEGKYALHQRAYRIHITKENIVSKFVYYFMTNSFYDYISKKAYSGTVKSIRMSMLTDFIIPLPPLDTQKRIVDILDNLEKYYNNLQESLTVEIEKRKKQYEFYRDKLLTFEKT